jgi:hypothetical protein
MTTVDQFLKALAMVESSDDPEAWGDAGRAMGRWQVHPDRLWSEARRYGLQPLLGETWDQFVARCLRARWQEESPTYGPTTIAMFWHLGHWSFVDKPDWDAKYAARFEAELAKA